LVIVRERAIRRRGDDKASCGNIPDQGKDGVAIDDGGAGDQDSPVGLQGDTGCTGIIGANWGGDHASAVKAGIETAIGVVAHHREVIVISIPIIGDSRHHDFAIVLHRDAPGLVRPNADSRGFQATASKAGIPTAIGIKPRHEKVAGIRIARRHDFAIALHRQTANANRRADAQESAGISAVA